MGITTKQLYSVQCIKSEYIFVIDTFYGFFYSNTYIYAFFIQHLSQFPIYLNVTVRIPTLSHPRVTSSFQSVRSSGWEDESSTQAPVNPHSDYPWKDIDCETLVNRINKKCSLDEANIFSSVSSRNKDDKYWHPRLEGQSTRPTIWGKSFIAHQLQQCFIWRFHYAFNQHSGMWQRGPTGSLARDCLHWFMHTEAVEQVGHRTVSAMARKRNVPLHEAKVLIMLLLDQTGLFNNKIFHVRL